jgi:hypothetical protein
MATRLQAIIDFAYKGGGIENAIGDMSKLAQGIGQVGRSATQMSVESAALDARTSLLSNKMNELALAVAQNKMTVEAATSEYQKFESKLISIPPKVEQTSTAFQRMKGTLSDATSAWMAIATPIQSTIQTLQQVGQAAQQAYQYVSEGTQLATTAHQFDALAISIGSTADALLGDLKTATRGTISDANLMASATSIMSLGLADTSEETVRLASLVGKLGWDMNQVTLTLANQSTMRLDSLGLSVEDVTGRIDALKAAGYSADQAFKFAILDAGEEKVQLLGDAADTTAGKLKILETNVANAGDSFKMAFSQQIITDVNSMAGGLFEASDSAEQFAEAGRFVSGVIYQWLDPFGKARDSIDAASGKFDEGVVSIKAHKGAVEANRAAMIASLTAIDDRREAIESNNAVLQQATALEMQNASAIYQQTSPAYAELQDKITQTTTDYDMNVQMVRAANLANKQLATTVPGVTGAVYASSEAVAAYNANLGKLYMQARQTEDAEMLLNSGIRQTSGGLREVSTLTAQQTDDLGRMQTAYDKAAGTIRDYELGVKGANLTDEERNEKIAEQQQIMATLTANMGPLIAAGSEWVAVQGQMVSFGPAVADAFLQSGEAIGMNASQLASVQLAFSDMAPGQAEAILKEAALAAEVQRLTQQMMDGNLTVYEARDAYIAFQEGLNNSTIAVNDATGSVLLMNDGMISSANSTQTLLDKFGAFPEEVGTRVKLDTSEAESRLSSLEARLAGLGSGGAPGTASGGYQANPDMPGQGPGFASGADFIVPPGYPNDSYPMRVQSGEHVKVTPAGQQTRGGDTYNLYVTAMDGGANVAREFNYLKSLAGA